MTAPARAAAHRVLRDVHSGRCDLPQAQARARRALDDPRDRALAAEIAIGTLRWRAALDCVLAQASSRALDTLDPDVLDVLRAAAYQLRHLQRVPAHAVVHDAVALTRTTARARAAGFVNAVLRTLAGRPQAAALPTRPAGAGRVGGLDRQRALAWLATTQSHPRWLVERWLDRYGFDAAARWTSFNNAAAPITIRANTLRISPPALAEQLASRGVEVAPGRWSPAALIVTRGNPLATDLAAAGLFQIQDEASQIVAELVRARPAERVLDACAAPGGKTVAIAGAMANRGLLVAGDRRPARLALLADRLARCGCGNTRTVRLDARGPLPFGAVFDRVLVDAPCSGLGTLRRDPDIRWRRRPDELQALGRLQSALLAGAATVVAPGGRLVYATCSGEPEENQDVVEAFLEREAEFRVEPPVAPHLEALVDAGGRLRTLPHRDGLEAFFAVVLRRTPGNRNR